MLRRHTMSFSAAVGKARRLAVTGLALLLAAAAFWAGSAWGEPALRAPSQELPVPKALVPQIEFWVDVFARYSYDQVVLHDRNDVSVVYEVVAMTETPWVVPASGYYEDPIEAARSYYAEVLARLCFAWPTPGELGAFRVAGLISPPRAKSVFCRASDNIRAQRGLRESFAQSVAASRMYLGTMKKILRQEGVPPELAYIPHVESGFRSDVTSAAGAAGIWQLTRETAAEYLEHLGDGASDQRYKPFAATRIAARYLRRAFEELGSWPLAVLAYNHGLAGVARAQKLLHTNEVGAIVLGYKGPGFGFASRNFYAEVIAAIHVAENAGRYFPDLGAHQFVYVVQRGDSLWSIARQHGVTVDVLRVANGIGDGNLIREGQRLVVSM